ncbi:MAG TPA: hypothetical protein VN495_03330 [Candidatus Paceibacterota bacterium]|nr:hypothetical protein [Candidatus Paceibacterota bacterium]
MKWGSVFGWGIAIYAVVYLAWSALVIHGFIEGIIPQVSLIIVLVAMVALAASCLRVSHRLDVLPYAIGWLLIAIFFDFVCAVPVSGWGIWHDWHIWVGYSLIILVPLILPTHKPRRVTRRRS